MTLGSVLAVIAGTVVALLLMLAHKRAALFAVGASEFLFGAMVYTLFDAAKNGGLSLDKILSDKDLRLAAVLLGISIAVFVIGMALAKFHASEEGEEFSLIVSVFMGALTLFLAAFYLAGAILCFILEVASDSGSSGGSCAPSSSSSSSSSYTPERREPEVYKEHIHPDGSYYREKMKVNSTGDMYYDPSDGDWHNI